MFLGIVDIGLDGVGEIGTQRRRIGIENDFENEWADFERIASGECARTGHELAIDERPVHAPQIADRRAVIRDSQQAVLPANQIAVGANVALGPTAEHEFAVRECQAVSPRLTLHDFESQTHADSLRGKIANLNPLGGDRRIV